MEIAIRELREEDIEELARIESESFSMPWSADSFRKLLAHAYCHYLVALADGKVVGCCGYTDLCHEDNIDNVVVASAYRRRGIGEALLRELGVRGDAMQVEAYTLEVRVGNLEAIRLYQKLGFVAEGVRPRFYEKPVEDALIMWRRCER